MNIKDLREFLATLPEEFDDYEMVNGEYGAFEDDEDDDEMYYRMDKPILGVVVDEETQEICFMNQSQEDINNIMGEPDGD